MFKIIIFLFLTLNGLIIGQPKSIDNVNYIQYLNKAEKQYDIDSFIKAVETITEFDQVKKYEVLVTDKVFERIFKLDEKYLKMFYSCDIFKLHSNIYKMIDGYAEYGPMIN